jgi:hypothetical protein
MNEPSKSLSALLAPDVGALVEYGTDSFGKEPGHYRVSGWIRVAPEPEFQPGDFLNEILFESCSKIHDARDGERKRMQFCLREEATHLSLSGICGAIAPIEQCKVTGMVPWDQAMLEEHRESARKVGATHRMLF